MKKQLLQNLTEYRQWAWNLYEKEENSHIAEAVGICPIYECWDSILNEDGEYVDIDEEGNVIPPDTAETVSLEDWVFEEITFPTMAVYWFEKDDWRGCDHEICACEFVSLSEFTKED